MSKEKKRTFIECLRYNIEHNWSEGGLFESMTKDDCLKACDCIERLHTDNQKIKAKADEVFRHTLWLASEFGKVLQERADLQKKLQAKEQSHG